MFQKRLPLGTLRETSPKLFKKSHRPQERCLQRWSMHRRHHTKVGRQDHLWKTMWAVCKNVKIPPTSTGPRYLTCLSNKPNARPDIRPPLKKRLVPCKASNSSKRNSVAQVDDEYPQRWTIDHLWKTMWSVCKNVKCSCGPKMSFRIN